MAAIELLETKTLLNILFMSFTIIQIVTMRQLHMIGLWNAFLCLKLIAKKQILKNILNIIGKTNKTILTIYGYPILKKSRVMIWM